MSAQASKRPVRWTLLEAEAPDRFGREGGMWRARIGGVDILVESINRGHGHEAWRISTGVGAFDCDAEADTREEAQALAERFATVLRGSRVAAWNDDLTARREAAQRAAPADAEARSRAIVNVDAPKPFDPHPLVLFLHCTHADAGGRRRGNRAKRGLQFWARVVDVSADAVTLTCRDAERTRVTMCRATGVLFEHPQWRASRSALEKIEAVGRQRAVGGSA